MTPLTDAEGLALAEESYARRIAHSTTACQSWASLQDWQRGQQRNPFVEREVEGIIAARIDAERTAIKAGLLALLGTTGGHSRSCIEADEDGPGRCNCTGAGLGLALDVLDAQ